MRRDLENSGFDGTILIYDLRGDRYVAGRSELIDAPFVPASTFKILNSMIALQTGEATSLDTVIAWDGILRPRGEINRDLALQEAFRLSAVPHFQYLARQIGPQRMQRWVDAVDYGNRNLQGGEDSFWLEGELRISPLEQIRFLKRLYENELPFAPAVMGAVKEMMEFEVGDEYVLRAKTGWAVLEELRNFGWWVGWVERGDDVYFFATLLEAKDPGRSFGPARISVTLAALKRLGALPGP